MTMGKRKLGRSGVAAMLVVSGTVSMAVTPAIAAVDCTPTVIATSAATQVLVIDTAIATNALIAAEFAAQTAALVLALQGTAAQISGNVRGAITGQGMLMEAASSQDTQRLIQGDRVEALQRNQFSTPLCQTATGSAIAVAQAAEAIPVAVTRSRVNADRTSGTGAGVAVEAQRAFDERTNLFCKKDDPACRGKDAGARANGDRAPGQILAVGQLANETDKTQAAWVIQNLTNPVPALALTERQILGPIGREAYLSRGGAETKQNLSKDIATEILRTRREPTGDPTYYNQLAAESGLAPATTGVSQEDMDRMRFRDRFNAAYTSRVASLSDPTVLMREMIALQAESIQQGYRHNQLLEYSALLLGSLLSTLQEPKINALAGSLN
jgi:hypothetical protein